MKQDELPSKQIKKMPLFFSRYLTGRSLLYFQEKFLSATLLLLLGSFITNIGFAAEINLFHERNDIAAEEIKEILNSTYFIPDELIQKIPVRDCEEVNKKGRLDLCLKNNGDLILVSVDRRFVNESLKAFRAH